MLSRVLMSAILWVPFHVFAQNAEATLHVIIASAGEDVLLPCTFPPLDWRDPRNFLIIKWQHGSSIIYHYEDEEHRPEWGLERFRGRIQMFHQEISKGNASALLTNVHLEDAGKYVCMVIWVSNYKETQLQLSVTGEDMPSAQVIIVGLSTLLVMILLLSLLESKRLKKRYRSLGKSNC
ncbi:CD276 antigen homolog isoform X1 [Polypterus senegalus]|uniref:CD276 antigen homolog isoform X1 n=1 Tax=Polypterus senegalus TaxID=55291 RepID=UPI0019662524|nr:CD276 antigen homolog isoform X1 [Polypterus senegalus]